MRWIVLLGLVAVTAGCSRENPLFAGDTDASTVGDTEMTAPASSAEDGDDASMSGGSDPTTDDSTAGPGSDASESHTDTGEPQTGDGDGTGPGPCAEYGPGCSGIGDPICGDTEKCVPVGNPELDQELKCVPVDEGAGDIGAACSQLCGPFEGIDDCVAGTICFRGACTQLCDLPDTDCVSPEQSCLHYGAAIFGFCLDACNPLVNDACDAGDTCIPTRDDTWVCIEDGSEGGTTQGSDCAQPNDCSFGFVCVGAEPGGCVGSCCTEVCELGVPSCPAGYDCSPWSADPPTGYESVGFCQYYG